MNNQEVEQQITELLSQSDHAQGIEKETLMLKAWQLIPINSRFDEEWINSTYGVVVSLIDYYCKTNQIEKTREWLKIEKVANTTGYRIFKYECFLGRVYFELGDLEQSFHYFDITYKEKGYFPFQFHDKKYWQFYKETKEKNAPKKSQKK